VLDRDSVNGAATRTPGVSPVGGLADILEWRSRILRAALRVVTLLGVVAYVPGTWLALRDGIFPIALANSVALAGVIALLLTPGLAYRARAVGFVAVMYLLALVLLVMLGPLGAGMVWLFAVPVLAAVFLGVAGAVYTTALAALTLLAIGALATATVLPWPDELVHDPMLWVVYATNFVLLNGAVTACVSVLLRGMEESVRVTTRALAAREAAEQERATMESRLLQAQKMEALGTLAGGIAHDFNNLLVPLIGNLEMARERTGDTPVAGLLGDALQAADRARGLVRGVLAFSRHSQPERGRVRLADTLDECQRLLRTALPSSIEIRQDARLDDAEVLADPVELHQLIMNLGTNAAHAMGATGTLMIRATVTSGRGVVPETFSPPGSAQNGPGPAGGQWIHIQVEDTGCGMDAATLERAREPFFTTRPVGQGTGLGLAIVHGIVQSLGGELVLESERGVGTVAHLYIPALAAETAGPSRISDRRARQGGTERILVVDDDEGARRTVALMLERLGYEVVAVRNGELAIDLFTADPDRFDLVVTDLSMPGITGIGVARHAIEQGVRAKVILMTGHMDTSLTDADVADQVAAVLTKPFGLDELASTVRNVLPR
jgi:signal transduction histidine kinase